MSNLIERCLEDNKGSKKKHSKRKEKKLQENQIIVNLEQQKPKQEQEKTQQDDFQLDNIEEILKKANKRTGLGFEENQTFGKIVGGFRKNIQKSKYIQEMKKKEKQKEEVQEEEDIKFDSKNEAIRERKVPLLFAKTKKKAIQKQKK